MSSRCRVGLKPDAGELRVFELVSDEAHVLVRIATHLSKYRPRDENLVYGLLYNKESQISEAQWAHRGIQSEAHGNLAQDGAWQV